MSSLVRTGESDPVLRDIEFPLDVDTINIRFTNIKKIDTTAPWPKVLVLNIPDDCVVNYEHFPNLTMLNGELYC